MQMCDLEPFSKIQSQLLYYSIGIGSMGVTDAGATSVNTRAKTNILNVNEQIIF